MEPSASSAPNAPNAPDAVSEPIPATAAPAPPAGKRPTLAVPKETAPNERRVALIPDAVKKYAGAGLTVLVETGAGEGSFFSDDAYTQAGAKIVPDAATLYGQGDLILKVQKPEPREIDQMKPGATLIAFLQPMVNLDLVRQLSKRQITAFSMDAIPRTTRAQYMDALSSMATVAGYKAVLLAADHTAKFFPLLTTAAGTIPPAKVLVIGAGVAGLMAIGTARRLGAVVEAYDARAVVKEQVESLGGKFVDIDTGADLAGAGGYAKEATEDILRKQQEGLGARAARTRHRHHHRRRARPSGTTTDPGLDGRADGARFGDRRSRRGNRRKLRVDRARRNRRANTG